MADILTEIRELGFIYGIITQKEEVDFSGSDFVAKLSEKIVLTDRYTPNYFDFSISEQKNTLKEALDLASYVREQNIITSTKDIKWLGGEKITEPYDVCVDGNNFSLKADSNILNNMGLYQMLNLFTGNASYKKGLHAFEEFSFNELCSWFEFVRNEIMKISNGSWSTSKNGKSYGITVSLDDIILNNNGDAITLKDFRYFTYDKYKKVHGKYKEKVIGRFIGNELSNNEEYIVKKKECSEKAGQGIVDILTANQNNASDLLTKIFRHSNEDYYFAKNDGTTISLYRVPNIEKIKNTAQVFSIESSSPKSQLNIITKINVNGSIIILRNEIRYSHRQLNGTPEAKLYYDKNSDLPYEIFKKNINSCFFSMLYFLILI